LSKPKEAQPHRPAQYSGEPALTFLEEVMSMTAGDGRIEMCIQCGSCGGSCPLAPDMDHSPRQLFALIKSDMHQAVLSSNTPWVCVSCYFCSVHCPQEIKITDVMYTLKNLSLKEKRYKDSTAPDFSVTFTQMVENYGRSYELGLATRHYLKHHPSRLPNMAPMGLGLMSKNRMDIRPHRIQGLEQLRAILHRARELEATP
jgi:quinone-modifying oxidoreductase, subunit QmoC